MAAETKMVGSRFLPALMVVALICVFAALGLLAFAGKDAGGGENSMREMNELLALSQKLPPRRSARTCKASPARPICSNKVRRS